MRVSSLVMLAVVASGCGGSVNGGETREGNAGPGQGAGGLGGSGGDSGTMTGGSAGVPSGQDAGSAGRYKDPVCAPAVKVQGVRECDVFAGQNACGPGAKCAPYVEYAMDCQTEEIGTRCVSAGVGVQGDDCANDRCAAGFVCVSGGVGLECARLCQNSQFDDCPPGLLCGELDVDGFFVCG